MPFATLRHVAIDPLPPPVQNAAIRTISYAPITQVHVLPKKKFWESDRLSPSIWPDAFAGTVYAQRFGPDPDEVMSLTAFASELARPHEQLFCGKHTALGSRGMEAALESAERAAVEVQLALG